MHLIRTVVTLLLGLSAPQLAACGTPGPILTESVGTLRTGVSLTRDQSQAAFAATNQTAREIDVARALARPEPNLREEDFPLALAPDDIAQWSNAFTALDTYLASLQKLVDPQRAATTSDELNGLAAQLREGPARLSLPQEATSAFAAFAGALVQARAERSATEVMRRVDPAFSAVMAGLAEAIGENDRSGLRQTTRLYWAGKLADLRASYAAIGGGAATLSQRRQVMASFLQAMDGRDAQLQGLAQLRASVLALGEAHSAAARGSHGDAQFWIGRIGGWLDQIQRSPPANRDGETNR